MNQQANVDRLLSEITSLSFPGVETEDDAWTSIRLRRRIHLVDRTGLHALNV